MNEDKDLVRDCAIDALNRLGSEIDALIIRALEVQIPEKHLQSMKNDETRGEA